MEQKTQLLQEKIIRHMSEGIIAVDEHGIVIFVNPALSGILETDASVFVGQPFLSFADANGDQPDFIGPVRDAVLQNRKLQDTILPYQAGGKEKQLRVYTSAILDESGSADGLMIDIKDVTELIDLRSSVDRMERKNTRLAGRNKYLNSVLGQYLSTEIAREVTSTTSAQPGTEGKKVFLSVLMSDLRGSTGISERLEAADYLRMLNHYLGEMIDVIHSCKGTVIEFVGDSILAVFGTPIPCEQHADAAVAAAIGMQNRMKEVNRWNRENGFPQLLMGIGVNTGDAVIGNIGTDRHLKYGATGMMINICSRIENFTLGGQVLAGPQTIASLQSRVSVREYLAIVPKGSSTEIRVADIHGIGEPYNLSCRIPSMRMRKPAEPLDASWFPIDENKNVGTDPVPCRILRISQTDAVFQSGLLPAKYDSIRLFLPGAGSLLGKIVKAGNDGCTVHFTSVPDSFALWCSGKQPSGKKQKSPRMRAER